MRLMIISDLHGAVDELLKLESEFKKADAVLFAGDFAKFGEAETGLPALKALCKMHDCIYAVLGNCDEPDFISELEDSDINVQGSLVYSEGLVFSGCGGGTKFTGVTPNERSEEEILGDLLPVKNVFSDSQESEWNNLILICHNPFFETKTDLAGGKNHVGSKKLRDFIEEVQPLLAVCGHIHESAAADKIGKCTVINPGSLQEGHYATVNLKNEDGIWSVSDFELF